MKEVFQNVLFKYVLHICYFYNHLQKYVIAIYLAAMKESRYGAVNDLDSGDTL